MARLLSVVLCALALLVPVAVARAAPVATPPCDDPALLCPDLRMATPSDLSVQRTPGGRSLLRSTNAILSLGLGPASVVGVRDGRHTMRVRQRIARRSGGFTTIPSAGRLMHKPIPGQGAPYWKFDNAAAMEVWTMGEGRRLVRRSPKLVYCLRDLRRTHPSSRSPRWRVFGACSQDRRARRLVLGTSVGWADIYPASYHEQYVDVTGLRGCFALWHVADPLNHLAELDESNNAARIVVRLPFGRGSVGRC
jgi:hypothetical protein